MSNSPPQTSSPNKNTQKLYEYMSANETVGTPEEFAKSIQDTDNLEKVWRYMASKGENVGSFDEFGSAVGIEKEKGLAGFKPFMPIHAVLSGFPEEIAAHLRGASVGVLHPLSKIPITRKLTDKYADPILISAADWLDELPKKVDSKQFGDMQQALSGNLIPKKLTFNEISKSFNKFSALLARNVSTMLSAKGASMMGGTPLGIAVMANAESGRFIKQANEVGIDKDIAENYAEMYGIVAGPVEYLQQLWNMSRFSKDGGTKQVAKRAFGEAMRKMATTKAGKIFTSFLGASGEGMEEVIQGGAQTWMINQAIGQMQKRHNLTEKEMPHIRFDTPTEEFLAGAAIGLGHSGAGAVYKGVKKGITKKGAPATIPEPAKFNEMKKIAEGVGLSVVETKSITTPAGKSKLGKIKKAAGEIEVTSKSPMVLAHEIGHSNYVRDVIKVKGMPKSEMDAVWKETRRLANKQGVSLPKKLLGYKYEAQPYEKVNKPFAEATADFVGLYLYDKETAKKIAPKMSAEYGADIEKHITGKIQEGRMRQKGTTPPLEPTAEIKKPIGAREIIEQVQRDFNVPIRTGHFKRKTQKGERLGIYKVSEEVVRLGEAEDLSTAAHEVAHHIDKSYLQLDMPTEKRGAVEKTFELPSLSNELRSELKQLDYDQNEQRETEGFAEFVRHWLTSGFNETKAPEFTKWFESDFFNRFPDIAKKLKNTKQQYQKWYMQGAENRVIGQIDFTGKGGKPPLKEQLQTIWYRSQAAWTDQGRWIKAATDDMLKSKPEDYSKVIATPYDIYTATAKTAAAKTRAFILDGVRDLSNTKTTKGLREILSPVSKDIESAMAYAYAKRALVTWKRGINPGITKRDAEHVVGKYKNNASFEDAAQGLDEWMDAVLKYWRDAGGLSEELYQKIKDANPFYIPLKRVFVDARGHTKQMGAGGRTLVDISQPVKKLSKEGSGSQIQDPLISLFSMTEQIIGAADRARVAKSLVEMAKSTPGSGKWVEKIDTPKQVAKTSLFNIIDQLEKAGIEADWKSGDIDVDALINIFSNAPGYFGKENIATVYEKGKKVFYEFHPDLYRAMKNMDSIHLPHAVHLIFGAPKRAVALGATGLRAGFQLITNPIRDAWTAMAQSVKPTVAQPIYALRSFLPSRKGQRQAFRAMGGEMAQPLGVDRRFLRSMRDEVLASSAKRKAMHIVKHPIDAMREVMSFSESMNRVAEYERAAKSLPAGETQAIKKMVAASEVTVNFKRAGYYSEIINQMVPFFNPAIQGVSKFARTLQARPFKAGLMAVTTITAPMLGLWYLHKDEDWYKELPSWEKQIFAHFKLGDRIIRIPLPFEWGYVFGAIPVAVAESIYSEDPTAIKKAAQEMDDVLLPDIIPAIAKPALEVIFNYDTFRKRPIVSRSLQGLRPEAQYTKHTPTTYKAIGEALGVSPLKLQHLVSGHTGGLSEDVAKSADSIKKLIQQEEIEPADIPILGRLFSREGRAGESVNDFFDAVEIVEKIERTLQKYYKEGDVDKYVDLMDKVRLSDKDLKRLRRKRRDLIEHIKFNNYEIANLIAEQELMYLKNILK